jgi:hypothetical protein
MIIIQTKHIPRIKETLVARNKECVIQHVQDELGLLDEYIVPIVYNNNEFLNDIFIELDDILLGLVEKHQFMIIYTTRVDFGLVTYNFKNNPVTHFETRLPQCVFVCILPDFNFDCDVTFQHSWIKLDNGITYELELLHENDNVVYDTRINGRFLEPGLCKVYKEEHFPICLEYIRDGYIKRRFISPIEL